MPIFNEIRARRGYSRVPHHEFLLKLQTVYKEVFDNPRFRQLPVDMPLFKKKIDEYSAAITATMTRSKIAYSQRDSLRADLEKMLLLLVSYVEHESNNDAAIFATSGIEALPTSHAPQTPLKKPIIPKIAHGPNSGVLQVWMPPSHRKISYFKLKYAPVDENHVPIGEWTEITVTSFQEPVTIRSLKPGILYAFQLQARGKQGETDWSDSDFKMCT